MCDHINKTYTDTTKTCTDCGQSWPIRGQKITWADRKLLLNTRVMTAQKLHRAKMRARHHDPIEHARRLERYQEVKRGINPPCTRTLKNPDKVTTYPITWNDTLTKSALPIEN